MYVLRKKNFFREIRNYTVAFVLNIVMSWLTFITFESSVIGLTDTFSSFVAWYIHHSEYVTVTIFTFGEVEIAIPTFRQKTKVIIMIIIIIKANTMKNTLHLSHLSPSITTFPSLRFLQIHPPSTSLHNYYITRIN